MSHQPPGREPEYESAMTDGMGRLWTPHRMAYIKGENKPDDSDLGDQCPFCRVPRLDDQDALIVARGQHVYAVLNLYPYNTGHLLICPYRHFADYTELTSDEAVELVEFGKLAMRAVRVAMQPDGFNLGTNQGAVSGAGIAAHLHQHIVPRWLGDANFMPIVGRTKVLPQKLPTTRALIADAWLELELAADPEPAD
jgi:ATP adenylyltransferase